MKAVIAIDSFKGSMSSMQAGQAAAQGIRRVYPDACIEIRPVADGGEGTVEALVEGMNGRRVSVMVEGPLGDPVEAVYGIVEKTRTAIMEMSAAAGLTLIAPEKRNPLYTSTFGVGEMIADAVHRGYRNFIIGIGGSATNDGGIGMLQALGFRAENERGENVERGATGLKELQKIRGEGRIPELADCTFHIACDVRNPLCGREGCSTVYGPQKGAHEAMIADMDVWMQNYAQIAVQYTADADPNFPGAGAAGGLGFAFRTFLNGRIENGIGLILRETEMEKYILEADIVLTGEGRIDAQTAMGKAPAGIAALAKKHGKPVVALAGSVSRDAVSCHKQGIDAMFPVLRRVTSLEEAMEEKNAKENMTDTAEQVFRMLRCFGWEK